MADYTHLVANGLVAAGDSVTVYTSPAASSLPLVPGLSVCQLPDHFGPKGLFRLDREFATRRRPDRVLIQYVPHAYGYKGMNLPFTTWVAMRAARIAPVWLMFHEVMYPIFSGQPFRHAILGRISRIMARLMSRSASRIFVSIPAWADLLQAICGTSPSAEWLPIPSNIPNAVDRVRVNEIRARIAPDVETVVIGHFGNHTPMTTDLLTGPFVNILRQAPSRVGLLVGRNGPAYRKQLGAEHGDILERVTATGELSAQQASEHLAACDLLIQPYPDGASSRRTTLMAGLALGVPMVTNRGFLSEPFWGDGSNGVTVAPSLSSADLCAAAEAILAQSPGDREARGRTIAAWYDAKFALVHTIARLQTA